MKQIEEDTPEAKAVVGLIFDTEAVMTSEKYYSQPPIISEASPVQCDTLRLYSYDSTKEYNYPTVYEHRFSENCAVLNPIVPTYFVYAGTWATMAVLMTLYLYVFIPVESRLSLQKSLLLLPALKAFEVILEGVWLDYCPWVGMSNSSY